MFGAGSSVSSRIPSAYDLIWDFKRKIYCSEQGYSIDYFRNLSDPSLRIQIQSYFDGKGRYPAFDSIEEYSFYFEYAYWNPEDRRRYVEQLMSGINLSYGHKAIGVSLKLKKIADIFTTNFDKAFEKAASEQFKSIEGWYSAELTTQKGV